MAQIDFSNAHIEPASTPNPVAGGIDDVGLTQNYMITGGGTGNSYNVPFTRSLIHNEPKKLTYQYAGTIPANCNGTELYLSKQAGYQPSWWKISNISFSAGDTFLFQISANII